MVLYIKSKCILNISLKKSFMRNKRLDIYIDKYDIGVIYKPAAVNKYYNHI